MSDLSDYKRCVSGPLEAELRATISAQGVEIERLRTKLSQCGVELEEAAKILRPNYPSVATLSTSKPRASRASSYPTWPRSSPLPLFEPMR